MEHPQSEPVVDMSQTETGRRVVRQKTVMKDVHDTQMSEKVSLNGLLLDEHNQIIEEIDIDVRNVSGEGDKLNDREGTSGNLNGQEEEAVDVVKCRR